MSGRRDPILTQFAVPPSAGVTNPLLESDRSTGLLYEPGATAPFVEELIGMSAAWRSLVRADTLLTETTDPTDPDFAGRVSQLFHSGLPRKARSHPRALLDGVV